jgi:hypothetical protein
MNWEAGTSAQDVSQSIDRYLKPDANSARGDDN